MASKTDLPIFFRHWLHAHGMMRPQLSEMHTAGGALTLSLGEIEELRQLLGQLARNEHERRAERAVLNLPHLLGEPAWDLLIYLFFNWADGLTVTVEEAADVMHTSNERGQAVMRELTDAEYIVSSRFPAPGAAATVRLSDQGLTRVGGYLFTIASGDPGFSGARLM